jgi:hypothetical protein
VSGFSISDAAAEQIEAARPALQRADGSRVADYARLRFSAVKTAL